MTRLTQFYDRYHQKNHRYQKLIRPNNFTYFYILQLLRLAGLRGLETKKVLDVGCGVGTLSLYCAALGATVKGIDVSPRAIKIADQANKSLGFQKVQFKQGELKQSSGPGKFDIALCFEVIEHVKNETVFLRAIHSQLAPDGMLLLSTPSSDNWLYRRGFYQTFDREVGHLRRYTPQTIKALLRKNGFEIVKLRQVEGPLRNMLFTTKLGFLIRGIRGPLVRPFHVLDHISGKVLGYTDIQVIARRLSTKA